MEIQPQNPEFRNIPENFHPVCAYEMKYQKSQYLQLSWNHSILRGLSVVLSHCECSQIFSQYLQLRGSVPEINLILNQSE